MINPFHYEGFALDEQFYGREVELAKIQKLIDNSNNLLLYSKRRMGKSSLIKELMHRNANQCFTLYCDIFDIASKEEFASILLKSLAKTHRGDLKTIVSNLKKYFKRISFGITVDPNTAEINYSPRLEGLSFEEMIEEFFEGLFLLGKEKKVILAIDEFQQIALLDTKIDALLRKYMQEPHNISYIFAGSKRHSIASLFTYSAPLYEMATHMELGGLDSQSILAYASKYLAINEVTVEYLIALCDHETKLMQHIFHILYSNQKSTTITPMMIDSALEEILGDKSSSYTLLYDTFSLTQKKAFKIITSDIENIFSLDTLKAYNIQKASLASALKQLYIKEIIDKEEDRWFVPDRTLELWGKRMLNR
jgi:AAA+ ATPase superfamily predicted ATPase